MKVDETGIPPVGQVPTSDGKRQSSASFSQVLGQKAEEAQRKRKDLPGERFPSPSEEEAWGLPIISFADQVQPNSLPPATGVASQAAPAIQGLVQELLVASKANGQSNVEIQFSSKTLEGLHVQINQQQKQVAIRFSTASESVSELLSRNLDQLSAALHSKGLETAPIQVEFAPALTSSSSAHSGAAPRERGREQSDGRRQEHKQRQK